ncbi:hypothetical protein E6P09_13305 [Haloferax mediterranei ATCC 33500]|uniref:Uncharacterized protein n=1 Tax=Haloferax mediterranei (strain ATCC 33500 / DSM 1411 / JCM 8866 / NBRC 14739 / NCIMB 2177 / R-4) TaxID=523841 RepID=I3R813_HALMT|nr:hypothetical protein [Haloferax mediterranei]AFK20373.1 hypothetical protein HFX_2695 [Haloferax mediterranei ATCC 33500]AHZ23738.1 hypothetical protein BM92_14285 [Haloferax mediterranei ATCC 33500]ELZ99228.1 hypothetical protein C439_15254 [Haloferax mediterranei ATCC 33500]MDX5986872.1 hypothetical protein [Haloferax mediterranei ATCC 33500]QCQ76196.1 hypothetical protein E6P09_13305 [Haloferax mediterranei ATCC 33500]
MTRTTQTGLRRFVRSRRLNAALAWLFVGFLTAVAIGSVVTGGDLVWGGFAAGVAILTVVPAVAFREPQAMLPWEVIALASFPLVARVLVRGQTIGGVMFTGRVSTYLAVAAVALIVAVELDVFTPVRMNYSFAIVFVVIATMAAAGVWAVVQWLSDIYLGTELLFNGRSDDVIETGLMWDFVAATVAGLVAGLLFEHYFRRRAGSRERLPNEVAEVGETQESEDGDLP